MHWSCEFELARRWFVVRVGSTDSGCCEDSVEISEFAYNDRSLDGTCDDAIESGRSYTESDPSVTSTLTVGRPMRLSWVCIWCGEGERVGGGDSKASGISYSLSAGWSSMGRCAESKKSEGSALVISREPRFCGVRTNLDQYLCSTHKGLPGKQSTHNRMPSNRGNSSLCVFGGLVRSGWHTDVGQIWRQEDCQRLFMGQVKRSNAGVLGCCAQGYSPSIAEVKGRTYKR